METALHSHDILTAELAEDKLARVALYCRYREVGDVCICKFIAVGDFSGKLTEASAPVCWAFTPQFDRDYAQMCIA